MAMGKVDKSSVKGIWKSDSEAWAGIDDVFPTDTPVRLEREANASVLFRKCSNLSCAARYCIVWLLNASLALRFFYVRMRTLLDIEQVYFV